MGVNTRKCGTLCGVWRQRIWLQGAGTGVTRGQGGECEHQQKVWRELRGMDCSHLELTYFDPASHLTCLTSPRLPLTFPGATPAIALTHPYLPLTCHLSPFHATGGTTPASSDPSRWSPPQRGSTSRWANSECGMKYREAHQTGTHFRHLSGNFTLIFQTGA